MIPFQVIPISTEMMCGKLIETLHHLWRLSRHIEARLMLAYCNTFGFTSDMN
jgi:hypothetical protein